MGFLARRDPLTSVPPSRHPFQIWLLLACALGGTSTVFSWGPPGTLEMLLPNWVVVVWGITLMIGGSVGLVAPWIPDAITSRLLERLALFGIGSMATVYAFVILYVAGRVGLVSFILLTAIGAASLWRVHQLNREIRVLGRWARRKIEMEKLREKGD